MRLLQSILTMILLAATAAPAVAEKRIALVIGNSIYPGLSDREQLRNAVNDARAVKTTLERLGFEVVPGGENLDRATLIERLSDFGARLGQGDIAFVFYAGHGISLNGANYILPTDIKRPQSTGRGEEARLADLAVAEARILERLAEAGVRVAVVVLDACRDNPLGRPGGRSVGSGRGLAPPPETRGVLSIYSAGAGQQALDRLSESDTDPNSVFTRVFLRKLLMPGLGLRAAAFETQGEVAALAAAAGHDQVPGVYSQILGEDVFLAGRGPAGSTAVPAEDTQQNELALAMEAGTVAALDAFLSKYPHGPLANIARRARIEFARSPPAVSPRPVAVVTPPLVPSAAVGPCGGLVLASLAARAPAPLSATEQCALRAKDEFKECADCPTMVVIPPGSYIMGSKTGESQRSDDEGPRRRVSIDKPFAVGKFTVTFAEWDACVAEGGCNHHMPGDMGWGRGEMPAVHVSWTDAKAYVAWLSRKTGEPYRLLSEAEWEYVARACRAVTCEDSVFWFGAAPSPDRANYNWSYSYAGSPKAQPQRRTERVGSRGANGFGLFDIVGNVSQWVEDCWNATLAGVPGDGSARTSGDCKSHVLRGGSWSDEPRDLRSAARKWDVTNARKAQIGFRVARSLAH